MLAVCLAAALANAAAPGGPAAPALLLLLLLLRSPPLWALPALGLALDRASPAAYQRWWEALLLLHCTILLLVLSDQVTAAANGSGAPPWFGSLLGYGGLLACLDAVFFKVGAADSRSWGLPQLALASQ
jgi:hypothetical protein